MLTRAGCRYTFSMLLVPAERLNVWRRAPTLQNENDCILAYDDMAKERFDSRKIFSQYMYM